MQASSTRRTSSFTLWLQILFARIMPRFSHPGKPVKQQTASMPLELHSGVCACGAVASESDLRESSGGDVARAADDALRAFFPAGGELDLFSGRSVCGYSFVSSDYAELRCKAAKGHGAQGSIHMLLRLDGFCAGWTSDLSHVWNHAAGF